MQEELNKIWGGWKIKELLGEGSFGKVYHIEREEFGYTYDAALKLITIPKNQSEVKSILNDGMDEKSVTVYFRSIVEDIVEEFALMSKLKGNTNIVSYEDHAVIPHEHGIGWNIYIRMELLTPLFDYLREHELSVRDVIRLGIEMCNALEICQKYNIIHRDIKPENMFVSNIGKFKLGDFGIARQLEKTSSGLSKKGTYTYMAPEVYKGEKYNSTVDIYSLGIVLYRFLNNNRTPFLPAYPNPIRYSDKEKANVMRMSGKDMPNPCNAEGRLAEIVLKACAYDPKDRYESAVEMKKALETVLDEEKETAFIYPEGDSLENNSVEYVNSEEEKNDFSDQKEPDDANKMIEETEGTFYIFGQSEEAKKKAEEARKRAEAEAKKKAEEEAKRRAEEEKKRAEAEAKKKAEEEAKKRAEEEKKRAEAEAKKKAEEEAKRRAEEEKKRAEAEAKKKAEEEAKRRAEEEKTKQKAERARQKAEEARRKAEEKERKIEEARAKRRERALNKKEMSAGTKKAIAAAATVLICIVGSKTGYGIYQKSLEREVPSVVNMTLEDAVKKAAGQDHSLSVKAGGEEYSDTVARGQIISQNIKAGTILKKGDRIEVIISKGKLVTVPDLVGKTEEEAGKEAKAAGLEFFVADHEYSDKVAKGKVISHMPKEGLQVEEHEKIGFIVSDGIEQVRVPDVKGASESNAKKELEKAKLRYSISRDYSDSVGEGKVISQSIKEGSSVDKNKKVKLVISLGEKPEPATTARPEPTTYSNKRPSTTKKKKPSGGGGDSIDSWDLIN